MLFGMVIAKKLILQVCKMEAVSGLWFVVERHGKHLETLRAIMKTEEVRSIRSD